MKKILSDVTALLLFFLSIALSGFVWAHSDEYLDTIEAPHGGQLRMAGPFHLELVAKDGELQLYVTDHMDKEISTKGGSGKANIFSGNGEKVSVNLTPFLSNMMKGQGKFELTPESAVSVFVVLEGYEAQGARFTPLAPKVTSDENSNAGDHHHHHHHDEDENHRHDDDLEIE
ncbi:MAG TPA: hypothetical protein PKG49_04950 [Nitrosomonas mobilis]|nr:hypothetical protein [Nitrosomonas mobilis]